MHDCIQDILCEEVLVVEGKNDTKNLSQILSCETIETNGFAVGEKLEDIAALAEEESLIVFTDTDKAGKAIRAIIHNAVPGLGDAELPVREGKIKEFVERARKDAILMALRNSGAHLTYRLRVLNNELDALSMPEIPKSAAA